jgi:hypothetical protein
VREIRLISPTGVSSAIPVWIEQYPLILDRAPNTNPSNPQPVSLPAIITGIIDGPGDADCYRFTALKGQQLVFNVIASRMRSGLDANLLLYDAATGHEIASNNDTYGADPFLAFTVPADGQYTLEIRDIQYRGAGDYTYRIEAGAIPFVQALSPMSSRRGTVVDVTPTGFNLSPGSGMAVAPIHLDLSHVPPGRIPVRVTTPAGVSNEVFFQVTELPETVETEPNNDAKAATVVSTGSDVNGSIGSPNDIDFFRFKLDKPARVVIDAVARRLGSPLDPLMTLHDANGNAVATNDDAAGVGADARIGRDLPAGEHVLSIRDLAFGGGPSYAYRITLQTTLAAPDAPPQDFGLRFQPDAPRIHRGGNAKLWLDLNRLNFPSEVAIAVEGLPPGVSISSSTTFPPVTSGILMLTATADAPLGSFPITIKATAPLLGELTTRIGKPEAANGQIVQQAYLTVLEAAPFTVQPVATLPGARITELANQVSALAAKVLAPSPEVDARQAEWEKKVSSTASWTPLDPTTFTSEGRANLEKQADGSILAKGGNPAMETYTVVANTDLKGIVAVRLECLTDPSLGNGAGPGRGANGNFVLSDFTATIAPKADPSKATPIAFASARATFSQGQFDVAMAIDDKPQTGWAIAPEMGKPQTAIFVAKAPAGADGGSVLTLKLVQNYGANHVIGKFRLSVTTDVATFDAPPAPENIIALVKIPPAQRTPQQKAALGIYYRTIDPPLAPDIAKTILLQTLVAPLAEMARLDEPLNKQSPTLDAEQAAWEQSMLNGAGWLPLDAADFQSDAGASFVKEADQSVFVFGPTAPTDTYTFVAPTALKNVTGLRIEALSDSRLPGNGPGRSSSGNFVLSGVKVFVAPAKEKGTGKPVEIETAVASHQQDKFAIGGVLDDKPETGWAVAPLLGQPAAADFFFKTPQGGDGGSVFTVKLEQLASAIPQHTLGHFRISLTTAASSDAAQRLPANILSIIKTPAGNRSGEQKNELAAFHRRLSKSLAPVRQRLTELRATSPAFPVAIQRGRAALLPVAITRGGNFAKGDVQVTVEGFSLGREGMSPAPITRSIKFAPLTIAGDNVVGALALTAEGNAEQGTRLVVLRAETKIGNDTIVEYSPAFALTVN